MSVATQAVETRKVEIRDDTAQAHVGQQLADYKRRKVGLYESKTEREVLTEAVLLEV